jgi:alkyl sulfatase BDS1-like metallo-beta-lactamase superfamily hydrolase
MTDAAAPRDATEATRRANAAVAAALPLEDRADFERATRGLVAGADHGPIAAPHGTAWDFDEYAFHAGPPPDTVNPSLWRQARLNAIHGLFTVTDGIHQVRDFDLSNVTFVEGATGWVVIDPLTATATARAALDLANRALGARPVRAVIYTHSHVDHFGGIRGVVTDEDVASGAVRVIAPEGFLAAAVSENVIAGNVMTRRATYMYGAFLPRGARGHVDAGLGKAVPRGPGGLVAPTETVGATGTVLDVDGVPIEFQITPGTEAPAEMNFLFPDHRALCMAENCTATLHNLYTPRGAEIRDALAWSKYIGEAVERYAARADVVFASHHWPRWGGDDLRAYLEQQQDLYRFLHDQTMRLANHGLTMVEIAEELELPPALRDEFHSRDYYGTVNHNAKAVYQKYLGWFDGNPAHLHPLPPVEAARRYVDLAGGPDRLLAHARESFERGDYRWVAELVNHLVFAQPDHAAARGLQADALEQLGYQAESGPWRAFYLTGAQELRTEIPAVAVPTTPGLDTLRAMTTEMVIDLLAVRIDGTAAAPHRLRIDLRILAGDAPTEDAPTEDTPAEDAPTEEHALTVRNGALSSHRGRHAPAAATVVTVERDALLSLVAGTATVSDLEDDGRLAIEGDAEALATLLGLLDTFHLLFPIVTP